MATELPEYVIIGRVEKAHGLRGEVKVRPLTDHPPRFKGVDKLFLELRNGEKKLLEVSKSSVRGNTVYLVFREVDCRDKAETLRGAYIKIEREAVLPLDDDAFYPFEVMGFDVRTENGQELGQITEVMDLAANAVLVVRNAQREYLVPVIRDVIVAIDKAASEIVIRPIEGLLD